jgi:lipopolysaccharide transport system ATP-binding protein
MSDVVIRAEGLSKRYKLGKRERYRALRDTLTDVLYAPARMARAVLRGERRSADAGDDSQIWALRDVSFEVQRGEVVGIIGRNGAGKSTLLKILSRITRPTVGRVGVRGRVGSLLEVGTGFHPELSGRENIFLNGAILGMRRAEIRRKFDHIVAFAEVEKFIDTPVKHYSSGMYMRLAFAVAAHLEPEILVVDEVLAVGDAQFQKKCLGKMREVGREGRTVLFVSHNMGAIKDLCSTAILLKNGQVALKDRADQAIRQYLDDGITGALDVSFEPGHNPQPSALITRFWVCTDDGQPLQNIEALKEFSVGLSLLVRRPIPDVEVSVRFSNSLDQPLFTTNLSDSRQHTLLAPGTHSFLIMIPGFLAPDRYTVTVGIHRPNIEILDYHQRILVFDVEETGTYMWQYRGTRYGNILVDFMWSRVAS